MLLDGLYGAYGILNARILNIIINLQLIPCKFYGMLKGKKLS